MLPREPSSPSGSSIGYIPALDGLRALAMLGILVFHMVPGSIPGGFLGVDIFFVLSGFLITAVMVHETANGIFSFREFYRRRVQRLVPNATLMILVTMLLWLLVLTPSAAENVARVGLTALFGASNIYLWLTTGGYWGDDTWSLPLLHTWALSVEVQFYVFFPVVLWLLLRRGRRQTHLALGALALISLAGALWSSRAAPNAGFYLLPTRAWQFLLGALLALPWLQRPLTRSHPSSVSGRLREIGGWVGLLVMLAGFVLMSSGDTWSGLVRLVVTLSAALVILAGLDQQGKLTRVLSWRPAAAMGKISYSLFLWHLPFIVFGTTYARVVG